MTYPNQKNNDSTREAPNNNHLPKLFQKILESDGKQRQHVNWNSVREHILNFPEDVRDEPHGWTLLSALASCEDVPIDVLNSVIRLHPSAAHKKAAYKLSPQGKIRPQFPLSTLCKRFETGAAPCFSHVEAILDAHPAAIIEETPLHSVCMYVWRSTLTLAKLVTMENTIRAFLDYYPSAGLICSKATDDHYFLGYPMQILSMRYCDLIRFYQNTPERVVQYVWDMYMMLLRPTCATTRKTDQRNVKPCCLMCVVLEMEQPSEAKWIVERMLQEEWPPGYTKPCNDRCCNPLLSVLERIHDIPFGPELLTEFACQFAYSAKVPNANGRVPLNVAIAKGCRWEHGVRQILEASAEVLIVRDPETHLYPFMLAAVAELNHLDTVYNLLKSSPTTASGLMEEAPWKKAESQRKLLLDEVDEWKKKCRMLERQLEESKQQNETSLSKIDELSHKNNDVQRENQSLLRENKELKDSLADTQGHSQVDEISTSVCRKRKR